MFVVHLQNMFHAGQNTRCTGLGMYGVTSDYKVHAKMYTILKRLTFFPFFVVVEESHLFLQNKVHVMRCIDDHNSL